MHASVWVCRHAGHGGSSSSRRGDKNHQYFYLNVWMLIDVLTAYLVERQKCLSKLWSNYTIKSDFYKISIGVISHALPLLCICAVTPELFRKLLELLLHLICTGRLGVRHRVAAYGRCSRQRRHNWSRTFLRIYWSDTQMPWIIRAAL